MPRSSLKRILGAALLAGALILACSDKGTEPKPVRYNIYAYTATPGGGYIYVIDADSLTVTDSIPGMDEVDNMVASADGRFLFAQLRINELRTFRTVKLDLQTKSIVGSYPDGTASDLILVDGGSRLVREKCGLEHIDPKSFTIVFVDTVFICDITGSADGSRVVGHSQDHRWLIVYDIHTRRTLARFEVRTVDGRPVEVFNAVLHPDGRRVLLLGREAEFRTWFLVVDIGTQRTLFQHAMILPYGEIGITPDGSRALVTDPGQQRLDQLVGTLDVYDLREPKHLVRFDHYWGYREAVAKVRFIPGTSIAIISPELRSTGRVSAFDWRTLVFSGWVFIDDYPSYGGIAVGVRPEG